MMSDIAFNTLLGQTLVKIDRNDEEMYFHTSEGETYKLYHAQDCCETVAIEEIIGELNDLLDQPLTMAEEVSGDAGPPDSDDGYTAESYTWTFYKLATNRGSVTLRWLGTSNGYYSERVDFVKLPKDGE